MSHQEYDQRDDQREALEFHRVLNRSQEAQAKADIARTNIYPQPSTAAKINRPIRVCKDCAHSRMRAQGKGTSNLAVPTAEDYVCRDNEVLKQSTTYLIIGDAYEGVSCWSARSSSTGNACGPDGLRFKSRHTAPESDDAKKS